MLVGVISQTAAFTLLIVYVSSFQIILDLYFPLVVRLVLHDRE